MANNKKSLNLFLNISLLLLLTSLILTYFSGINPFLGILWNLISSLGIDFILIDPTHAPNLLLFISNIIDSFIFIALAIFLANWFYGFLRIFDLEFKITESKIKFLKNHIIITPYTPLSLFLIKELKKLKMKYVVITESEKIARRLNRTGALALFGKVGSLELFELAGIKNASCVVACSENDIKNILITISARSVNKNIKIISSLKKLENVKRLNLAGVNKTVLPENSVGLLIGNEISRKYLS